MKTTAWGRLFVSVTLARAEGSEATELGEPRGNSEAPGHTEALEGRPAAATDV